MIPEFYNSKDYSQGHVKVHASMNFTQFRRLYKFVRLYGLLRFRSRNPTNLRKSIRSFFAYLFSSGLFGLQGHVKVHASMNFT